jgi:hypothetical protein
MARVQFDGTKSERSMILLFGLIYVVGIIIGAAIIKTWFKGML